MEMRKEARRKRERQQPNDVRELMSDRAALKKKQKQKVSSGKRESNKDAT